MRVLFFVVLVSSLAGCAPSETMPPAEVRGAPTGYTILESAEIPDATLDEARGASKQLMAQLKGRLLASLEEHGPAGSIEVCSIAAPEIAASVQTGTMKVRRVSLKVRNPEDEPDAYERATLERLTELFAHDPQSVPAEVAQVVEMPDQRKVLRYMTPLSIAKPCLTCHGPAAELDEAVKARLDSLYPEDRATGYVDGDLRGAVSVVVNLS